MVLLARDGAYEARTHDGVGAVPAQRRRTATRCSRPRASTRSPTSRPTVHAARRRARPPQPAPRRERLPATRTTRSPSSSTTRPRPTCACIHSADHNWEDQGGHRGEHGSLGIVQARAPFVLAGKGVRTDGLVPRGRRASSTSRRRCSSCSGVPPDADGRHLAGPGRRRARRRARPRRRRARRTSSCSSSTAPTRTCSTTWPRVARRRTSRASSTMGTGVRARRDGRASRPSRWRTTRRSSPGASRATTGSSTTRGSTGARRADHHELERHLADGDAARSTASSRSTRVLHRHEPGAFTASVNEPCDIGADYSTFDFFRRGEVPPIPKTPDGLPHTTERFVRPSKDYSWSSVVDHMGTEQAVGIWSGSTATRRTRFPGSCSRNFTLTDAAMHEGGPHSEIAAASIRDSDARMGEIIAAVERAGVFDDTAFVLVADHGMEETDPAVTRRLGRRPARRGPHVPRRGLRLPVPRRAARPVAVSRGRSRPPRGTGPAGARADPRRARSWLRRTREQVAGAAAARARPRRSCRRSSGPSASRTRSRVTSYTSTSVRSAIVVSIQCDACTRRTVVEPAGPLRQNAAKSCSPTNGSAARRSSERSSGSGDPPRVPREERVGHAAR